MVHRFPPETQSQVIRGKLEERVGRIIVLGGTGWVVYSIEISVYTSIKCTQT